ncbi:MAG: alpha/beta fold hydrolase [Alphaproteobacteria bacterium]|nr:alpha/beta fold hydrolase [Alphaproteobacteria bacterium]
MGYRAMTRNRTAAPLPAALPGGRLETDGVAGRLSCYATIPAPDDRDHDPRPLLLLHSINAAGSAYEMRPLYEYYRKYRPVYAPDLPGFGMSERSDRRYGPRLMTDAVHAVVEQIQARHGAAPIDAIALSLSCEFLARAAVETPGSFRVLGLISPTGFDQRTPEGGPPGGTRGRPLLYQTLTVPPWRHGLFELLSSRASIRYFLEKTWGSKNIDEGLLEYDYLTTHQPGASFAPYRFVSGFLFSTDILNLYRRLAMPVWMVHGDRGDFVDYQKKTEIADRPNWHIEELPTGALPHFEIPARVIASYDAFSRAAVTAD